jgi:hypothetical protein
MKDAAAFCKSLEWSDSDAIAWSGPSGWLTINDDLRANIFLTSTPHGGMGYADHYYGMAVDIVSKTRGKIANESFAFDDFLHDRIDDRRDYTGESRGVFCVISSVKWDWYIAIPTSTKPFTRTIEAFIAMFE